MARTRHRGGTAGGVSRGGGTAALVPVPVPRGEVLAWLMLVETGKTTWSRRMAAPRGHLNQPATRPARPVLRALRHSISASLPNSLLRILSLPLPSQVPDILYHRRLQVPCLKSQHIALPFFYLLPFPILYFLSQLFLEFLYFSLYSCPCF